jgi:membrane associated rhomboid family serine protease
MDDAPRCYRHPDRETYVSCSECGRPICEECMTFAPVGIRCPEHATVGTPKGTAQRTARQVRGGFISHPAPATLILVIANIAIYLVTVYQGAGPNLPGGSLFVDWALQGFAVASGDWYRLITAMFLHGSLLHLAFNMLALWWLGSIVEQAMGTLRFLLVYFVSGLAGSAGALLLSDPGQVTVGASGAIYGILGALLILEWLQTGSLAGPAMTLIVLNLALSLAIPGISIGGHLGGLVGGIAATWVLTQTRYARSPLIGPGLVVLIGVLSVAVAWVRVENYAL